MCPSSTPRPEGRAQVGWPAAWVRRGGAGSPTVLGTECLASRPSVVVSPVILERGVRRTPHEGQAGQGRTKWAVEMVPGEDLRQQRRGAGGLWWRGVPTRSGQVSAQISYLTVTQEREREGQVGTYRGGLWGSPWSPQPGTAPRLASLCLLSPRAAPLTRPGQSWEQLALDRWLV